MSRGKHTYNRHPEWIVKVLFWLVVIGLVGGVVKWLSGW